MLEAVPVKKATNYKIDWAGSDGSESQVYKDRLNYFKMLRAFVSDLAELKYSAIEEIFKKHSVHFVDIEGDAGADFFPRVNLDIPEGKEKHGDR